MRRQVKNQHRGTPFLFSSFHHLQPDYGSDQCGYEKQTGQRRRLMKEHDAQDYRPHRSDSRPYRISRPDRQCLYGLGKQNHAGHQTKQEPRSPKIICQSFHAFHLSQTKRETGLKQSTIKIAQAISILKQWLMIKNAANIHKICRFLCMFAYRQQKNRLL